jgi:hypothetical protein
MGTSLQIEDFALQTLDNLLQEPWDRGGPHAITSAVERRYISSTNSDQIIITHCYCMSFKLSYQSVIVSS